MNAKKYIVRGGYVTSKNDRKWHYISARDVARLYGVQHSECIFPVRASDLSGFGQKLLSQLIELGPQSSGNYSLTAKLKKMKKMHQDGAHKGSLLEG